MSYMQEQLAFAKRELKHDRKGTKKHPAPTFIIGIIEDAISQLSRRVHEMAPMSASSFAPPQKENVQPKLLHGSDVPTSEREITLHITGIRQSPPGFNSPLILDFETKYNCAALALNKTNVRALGMLCEQTFGNDDLEKLIGKDVIFQVVNDTNPTTKQAVRTLRAASIAAATVSTKNKKR